METKILRCLMDSRQSYNATAGYVSDDMFSTLSGMVMEELRDYYEADPDVSGVDREIVHARVARRLTSNKHEKELASLFNRIESEDVSGVNVVREVIAERKQVLSHKLADALINGSDDLVVDLIDEYVEVSSTNEIEGVTEVHTGTAIEEILEAFSSENRIRILPRSLNHRLGGGVIAGNHIVISALPELGKSLVAINMACGVAAQGRKVLLLGNEEPIRSTILRCVSCLTGMDQETITEDPGVAMDMAVSNGYRNMTFVQITPGSVTEIDMLMRRYEPDFCIIDQIRNLGARAENRVNQLDTIARGVRSLGIKHQCVMVSITQAADSARDRLVLDSGDIDSSNIGIPASADVLLLIGANEEYMHQGLRQYNLVKNKISGDHSNWVVAIKPEISRVVDDFSK